MTKERLDEVAWNIQNNGNNAGAIYNFFRSIEEGKEILRLARLGLEYESKEPWVIEDGTPIKYSDQYFLKLAKWAEDAIPKLRLIEEWGHGPHEFDGEKTWNIQAVQAKELLAALPEGK